MKANLDHHSIIYQEMHDDLLKAKEEVTRLGKIVNGVGKHCSSKLSAIFFVAAAASPPVFGLRLWPLFWKSGRWAGGSLTHAAGVFWNSAITSSAQRHFAMPM